MTLILTVFLLILFNEFISWIGKSVLQDAAYGLYLRLFYSSQSARQRQLKSEILSTKAELMKTSAQDQFAKWAKLRRSVDKGMGELDALNSQLSSTKTSFSVQFSAFLWILTTGVYYVVTYSNRNAAVFYLPPGWLWGPLEWCLSLPFAPRGSVSVGVWSFACRRVIKVGERLVKEAFVSEPAPVAAQSVSSEKTEKSETKKEQ